ncbi:hypothetical protein ACHAWU_005055 [Discostella pseudostelligera]|uniref:Uncharacterized protein n=1 Tax=Discostella pseudostelligera TaxID=259834 RepID=A0ABD3MCX4_9STRA
MTTSTSPGSSSSISISISKPTLTSASRRRETMTRLTSMLPIAILAISLLSSSSSTRVDGFYCYAFNAASSYSSSRTTASSPKRAAAAASAFHSSHTVAIPTGTTSTTARLLHSRSIHGMMSTTVATTTAAKTITTSPSSTALQAIAPSLPTAAVVVNSNPLLQSSLLLSFIHKYPLLHKPILALSTLAATIAGGIFSGSLHAISGPDHLAALVPRCVGLPWHRAARIGAVWGVGHGASATLLGLVGFVIRQGLLSSVFSSRLMLLGDGADGRQFDLLHHAGSFMELAIGVSLIVIGLVGLKEAREWHPTLAATTTAPDASASMAISVVEETVASSSSSADAANNNINNVVTPAKKGKGTKTTKRAVLFNGMLHGFSWDGAPSLAPAVAISSFTGSLTFLLSYAVGTTAAMGLATALIGEGTRRAAGKLDRPNLPRDLGVWSSLVAMMVGVLWCYLALR